MGLITSEKLMIGDGKFPWNLRPFRHHSERICFLTSIVANTILIVLLVREKNATMKPYSRVLLLNVFFDYVYTLVSIVVEMELEFNQGTYIFVLNGLPKHLSPHWQKMFVGLWMYAISSTCAVSAVEFVFRYLLVVKGYTSSYFTIFFMGMGAALVGVNNGVLIYLTINSVEDPVQEFSDRMTDTMWFEGGKQVVFHCADRSNLFFQLFLLSVCIEDVIVVSIMVFSTWKTLRMLAASKHFMSPKVRYLQSQLNRLMFAEVFSLTSVFAIPIGTAMILLILGVQWVGFGVLIALILEWVPSVNPMTTILLVAPYRRQLIGKCLEKFKINVATSHTQDTQPHSTNLSSFQELQSNWNTAEHFARR